jgi:hypothetical protein
MNRRGLAPKGGSVRRTSRPTVHHSLVLAALLGGALVTGHASAASLSSILDDIHWGERSNELAQHFGSRAKVLPHPIEFGDSYVDVALSNQMLGGFEFIVYFQMSTETQELKRIMLERQRHGANPRVFNAVVEALSADYGAPVRACDTRAMPDNGHQSTRERIWSTSDTVIRAVFRDTTLEATEGCFEVTATPCGLTGQLFVQITPSEPGADACR